MTGHESGLREAEQEAHRRYGHGGLHASKAHTEDIMDAFVKGAEWGAAHPAPVPAATLTEAEREALHRAMYGPGFATKSRALVMESVERILAARFPDPRGPRGDVDAAIRTVEDSMQTHVEWGDYWREYEAHRATCAESPCPWEAVREQQEQIAGDLARQERLVSEYETVLRVLRSGLAARQPATVDDEPVLCTAYYTDGPHPSYACGLPADHWPGPHSWQVSEMRDRRGDLWVRSGRDRWSLPGDRLSARSLRALSAQLGPLTAVVPAPEGETDIAAPEGCVDPRCPFAAIDHRPADHSGCVSHSPAAPAAREGVEPLVEFLPLIRGFVPATFEAGDADLCVSCGDGECGGACPTALFAVRQVREAFDSEDDRDWWRDYFANEAPVEPKTSEPEGEEATEGCGSRGPEIGEDGTLCRRSKGHEMPHRTAPDDGFGNIEWTDPPVAAKERTYDHRDNAGPWVHDDGTPCHHYWSDRPSAPSGGAWWCTEHQQHVHTSAPEGGTTEGGDRDA